MSTKMDVRAEFLNFFKNKGHMVYDSAPLVPEDASLLFTNAGMVQFKDIFTGKIPRPNTPIATSSQLCIRAGGKHNDLENVGYTSRHHTLFEMLGNFSFGEYFKTDAIAYAWEFVTEVLKFDKEKLYVTIHESDDEAYEIWQKHIDKSRIKRMGDKDNFWQMGDTGPCGPCSEIFVDQGEEHFHGEEDYFGGDGDRFLEIWNLVFMQFERDESGKLTPLPKPSIDTGMGLERVVALKEGAISNFSTSLFMPYIKEVERLTKKPYVYESGASYRVIADHARSVAFLLAQGVNFDKEGRGYVLRRILRRAVRHGYLLGLKEAFLYKIVEMVCDNMSKAYPYLSEKKSAISTQCKAEEERFYSTIELGMESFNDVASKLKKGDVFSGEVAFKLYDTYGFPLDLTQDMLKDRDILVDINAFDKCMEIQKKQAKANWKGSGDEVKNGDFKELLDRFGQNVFDGYVELELEGKVLALLDSNFKMIDELDTHGYVLFDKTPLYAESGGAIGDSGSLYKGNQKVAEVIYTKKYFGLNIAEISPSEKIKTNEILKIIVDKKRLEITKHHSATHLLHAALRKILGTHVAQAGSLVESSRFRFDFSHPKALSAEEIDAIEKEVNANIVSCVPSVVEHMDKQSAINAGAMALFSEKYGDIVRVVSFVESDSQKVISRELCGGVHVFNTGIIGGFYITKESSVSSGVRRIEAVCGKAGLEYIKSYKEQILHLQAELKNNDVLKAVENLKENIKELKSKATKSISQSFKSEKIGDVELIVEMAKNENIKEDIDNIKNKYDKVAILLLHNNSDKIALACGIKGIDTLKAGEWIKSVAMSLGGNGGGRNDFATAGVNGAKDEKQCLDALSLAKKIALESIKGSK